MITRDFVIIRSVDAHDMAVLSPLGRKEEAVVTSK
jgi:hypothetical protein